MIGVFPEPAFLAGKFLEMPFGRFRAALLQTPAQRMMPLAVSLNLLSAKGLPLRVSSQIDDAQINAQGIRWRVGGRRGNLEGHSQGENAVTIDEVSLPLHLVKSRLLIGTDTKRYHYSAGEGQEGDGVQSLEGHHPFIINNRPFRLKSRLDALITFVGFTGLADTANSQLRSKLIGGAQLSIHQLLQLELVRRFLAHSNFRHVVGRCIKSVHGIKQGVVLLGCWSKLQEHRLFHRKSVHPLREVVTRQEETQPLAPIRNAPFLPRSEDAGHPGAVLVKKQKGTQKGALVY